MKKILLLSFILFFGSITFSQERKLAKGNEKYENYSYMEAIKIYEKIYKKGYSDPEMLKKLGNSYYLNADFQNAEKWYALLIKDSSNIDPEYYYRYSQCLKTKGDYTLANEFLNKFSIEKPNDSRAKKYQDNKKYLDNIKNNSDRFAIKDSGISSEYPEYGGFLYKDDFIYTLAKDTKALTNNIHNWTNQAFSNLYTASMASDGSLSNSEPFSKNINTKFHESNAVITKDGKIIYFTRNNYNKEKKRTNSNDAILLKLYRAELVNDKWENIFELPFNNDKYNIAHPALSSDNKTLYFASDMPGTMGLSDLFKVSINDDGTFGSPENLGAEVNTEGKESFPFISKNNELYFSSDGHLGLGGLDVFAFKINDDGSYSKIYNIGTPINSSSDDFAYIINTTTKTGYFSSNRPGGKGFDDIYKFTENKPLSLKSTQSIEIVVLDEKTSEVISNASVILMDELMKQIVEKSTDENKKVTFESLDSDTKYFLKTTSKGYKTVENPVITEKENGKTLLKVYLTKEVKNIEKGDNLTNKFEINHIYFDLDKWNIRKDAVKDLMKIVEVMKQNPSIKVEIRSHTDSRQTNEYNLKLSQKRAKSTMKWLIKQGINADRLTSKGYGESQLINNCTDGVNCSEEEHQRNRRSDFIIIEM